MKKLLAFILTSAKLCIIFTACEKGEKEMNNTQPPTNEPTAAPTDAVDDGKVYATIEMMDGGIIKLELYPDIAPQSVYNFCSLARKGFYDGVIFHRVISGFMIQGGDPEGTGRGGPGYCIKGEFAVNGFENNLSHTRGVISMARRGDPYFNSAGSQFFIVHEDSIFLDGSYAAFGMVLEGMDVVDRIAGVAVNSNNKPYEDVVIKTITIQGPEFPEPDHYPAN